MTKRDFMEKIWEGLLAFLLKQAFSVVILTLGLAGVIFHSDKQEAKFDKQMAALKVDLQICNSVREQDAKTITHLSVQEGILTERVNILTSAKRRN